MLKKKLAILLSLFFLLHFGVTAQTFHIDGYVLLENNLLPVESQFVEIHNDQGDILAWFLTNSNGFYSGDFGIDSIASSYVEVTMWKLCDGIPESYTQQITLDKVYLTANFLVCDDINCRAQFNVVQTNLNQLQFEFTDISSGDITDWFWDFDDGTFSTEQNPVHTFQQQGPHHVSLSISGVKCNDFALENVLVFPHECLAKFSWEQINQGDDLVMHFSDESLGGVIFWNWDFGDGAISAEQNPTHQYANPGEYVVELSAHKPGCWHTIRNTVIVAPLPQCYAHFGGEQLISGNYEMAFTDLSIGDSIASWTWQFGDGALSSIKNPTHIYENPGNYSVSLTIVTDNCTDAFSRMMKIVGSNSCIAGFDFGQPDPDVPEVFFENLAPADSLLYFWDFGDGESSNEFSPSHTYPNFGNYTASLKILGYGCVDSVAQLIQLVEPVYCGADFSFGQSFPQSRLINFTNQSFGNGISSHWDFGDGNFSEQANPVHEYQAAGVYEVQLIIMTSDSCSDSLVRPVEILPPLTISGIVWAGENQLSLGEVLLYKKADGSGIEWYGQQDLTDGSFVFTDLTPGEYFLQAIPVFNFPFPMIPNYFPTYSGQEMKWQDALLINTNDLPDDVQVHLLQYDDFFDGKAALSGRVNVQAEGSNTPLIIYLTDDQYQIMDSRLVGENMKFEFIDIPYGYYKVYPEKAGKTGQPFSIELNEASPVLENLIFIENADLIYPDLTGIDQQVAESITISPNPASEKLAISIPENFDTSQLKLRIFSANGLSLSVPANEGTTIIIDVSGFPQGLYILELTAMKTKIYRKFLIQH